jgi:hypothetical protein
LRSEQWVKAAAEEIAALPKEADPSAPVFTWEQPTAGNADTIERSCASTGTGKHERRTPLTAAELDHAHDGVAREGSPDLPPIPGDAECATCREHDALTTMLQDGKA